MGNSGGARESRVGLTANFTSDEIRRLGLRFEKLDRDKSGSISIEEFMALPEIKKNPMASRVISIFDVDKNGQVDFKEFIRGMSMISCRGDNKRKLRFAFTMYDMDKDGLISNGELFTSLKSMVGDNIESEPLQQIVDKTIIFGDKDGDGKISFEEFVELVVGNDSNETPSE